MESLSAWAQSDRIKSGRGSGAATGTDAKNVGKNGKKRFKRDELKSIKTFFYTTSMAMGT